MISTSFADRLVFRKTVQIDRLDLTAEQWDAYTTEPGAEDAAKRVNAAILIAVNAGGDRATVMKAANKAMWAEGEYGFADSEATYVLDRLLDMLFGRQDR